VEFQRPGAGEEETETVGEGIVVQLDLVKEVRGFLRFVEKEVEWGSLALDGLTGVQTHDVRQKMRVGSQFAPQVNVVEVQVEDRGRGNTARSYQTGDELSDQGRLSRSSGACEQLNRTGLDGTQEVPGGGTVNPPGVGLPGASPPGVLGKEERIVHEGYKITM
jgi:hypothetical protein